MNASDKTGRLTTHVLDTARGVPAVGLRIALFRLDGDTALPLGEAVTNGDGRTDAPMLAGDDVTAGRYELRFHAGDYLRAGGVGADGDIPFLDIVPIRFGIADATAHYHVPLLLSPFG